MLHISLFPFSRCRRCLVGVMVDSFTTHVSGRLYQLLRRQGPTGITPSCSALPVPVPGKPFPTTAVISYFVGV